MSVSVRQGDRSRPLHDALLPVVLVLDRLRSAHNVGNIFRVAEATRVTKIIACGYTPSPPHPKLAKTARGCDEIVPCEEAADAASAILALKADGYKVYAVETAEEAQMYWDCPLQFPAALVLGNEALGIAPDALALCDALIALPARGQKNSINVGNCAAVVLFECLRQNLAAQAEKC
jgi:23S rRNA (guanosine2251-2'-O)-methyltransferase